MENLYELLEVTADASMEELRKSYVRLAKLYHPDKLMQDDEAGNTNFSATSYGNDSKFVKLNHAWTILSDPNLRKQYDIKWKERCLSQYLPIQENVPFSEFELSDEEQVYLYPCRCGSDYVLSRIDAQLFYDIVCCETCSLTIQVEYNK